MNTDQTLHAPVPDPQRQLPPKAAMTTAENPWPLSLLARKIDEYVDRMSELWVEGQVVEYKPRSATRMAFFVLRDVNADVSMTITALPHLISPLGEGFEEGARVVICAKPNYWDKRGTFSLRAREVRLQGTGDLLAQIERLRARLAAEGLFDPATRKPLPFLPRVIGLICGRNAKAKDDVLVNARLRWPTASFEIREVAVQGQYASAEVAAALAELDQMALLDVIVVARGGGSVEDLLPFSDEGLVRAASRCQTPLVSAIGHEGDAPLLDLVADYRASTPTDAARRIVPDAREEQTHIEHLSARARSSITKRLSQEKDNLQLLTSRPVLVSPGETIVHQLRGLDATLSRLRNSILRRVTSEQNTLGQAEATLRALSPQATLERGYAIIRRSDGTIVHLAEDLTRGELLEGLLAKGTFVAQVVGSNPEGGISDSHN